MSSPLLPLMAAAVPQDDPERPDSAKYLRNLAKLWQAGKSRTAGLRYLTERTDLEDPEGFLSANWPAGEPKPAALDSIRALPDASAQREGPRFLQPKGPPPPESGVGIRGQSIMAMFDAINPLTDEMAGVVGGVGAMLADPRKGSFQRGYTETRDAARAPVREFTYYNPGLKTAENIMAALLTPPLLGPSRAVTPLGRVLGTGLRGAAEGGLYSFGSAEGDLLDQAVQTAVGGGLGGLTAGAVQAGANRVLRDRAGDVLADAARRDDRTLEELFRPRRASGREPTVDPMVSDEFVAPRRVPRGRTPPPDAPPPSAGASIQPPPPPASPAPTQQPRRQSPGDLTVSVPKTRPRKEMAQLGDDDLILWLRDSDALLQNTRVRSNLRVFETDDHLHGVSRAGGGLGGHIQREARKRSESIMDELNRRGLTDEQIYDRMDQIEERRSIQQIERGALAAPRPRSIGDTPFSMLRDESGFLRIPDRQTPARPPLNLPADVTGAELLGRAGNDVAARVARQGGAPADRLVASVAETEAGATGRIREAAGEALEVGQRDPRQTLRRLSQIQRETSPDLYALAYGPPEAPRLIEVTDELRAVLEEPKVRAALQEGVALENRDPARTVKLPSPYNDAGELVSDAIPVEVLDKAKQGMDAIVAKAPQGKASITTREAQIDRSWLDRLRREIDAQNPEYAEARSRFAGIERQKDVLRQGLDAFKPSERVQGKPWPKTPASQRAALQAMTPAEQTLYREGALYSMARRVRKGKLPEGAIDQLRAILPDGADVQLVLDALEREGQRADFAALVRAAAKRPAADEIERLGQAPLEFAAGMPRRGFFSLFSGMTKGKGGDLPLATREAVADFLTARGPELEQAVDATLTRRRRLDQGMGAAARVGRAAAPTGLALVADWFRERGIIP